MRNESVNRSATKRIVLFSIMIALGTTFSIFLGAIPIGPTKVFPFQHMINGITGVLLGPLNAGFIALAIGILRISIGTGTFFAIPGGIPGALMVGINNLPLSQKERLGGAHGADRECDRGVDKRVTDVPGHNDSMATLRDLLLHEQCALSYNRRSHNACSQKERSS